MKRLKLRELRNGDEIHFTPITKEYGRAEFNICPIWENGQIVKVYIYPMANPDAEEYWVIKTPGRQQFRVDSWTHKGMNRPWHWLFYWCTEHRCMSFRSYAPDGATKFTVRVTSDVSIYFDRDQKEG